ncbi:MAG: gas vesicle accessory protein GvpU [Pyrinomonadaceae bacterium]
MDESTFLLQGEGTDFVLTVVLAAGEELNDPLISITLNVGGILISGDVISEEEYLKEFMNGVLSRSLKNFLGTNKELKDKLENVDKPKKRFIHLKNAKFLIPGAPPVPAGKEGALWRGRLESIDGFFYGRLDTKE